MHTYMHGRTHTQTHKHKTCTHVDREETHSHTHTPLHTRQRRVQPEIGFWLRSRGRTTPPTTGRDETMSHRGEGGGGGSARGQTQAQPGGPHPRRMCHEAHQATPKDRRQKAVRIGRTAAMPPTTPTPPPPHQALPPAPPGGAGGQAPKRCATRAVDTTHTYTLKHEHTQTHSHTCLCSHFFSARRNDNITHVPTTRGAQQMQAQPKPRARKTNKKPRSIARLWAPQPNKCLSTQ